MTDQARPSRDCDPIFAAPRATVLSDEVVLAIEKAILLGTVSPGQRLVEADIARQMGISKAPVREALRHLAQMGLVVNHARRGTFVTQITATLASEAFSLRALLETHAIRLAIGSLDNGHFARMDELLLAAEAVAAQDRGAMVERDLCYHDLLFDASNHRLLQDAWRNLRPQIRLLLVASGVLRAADGRPRTMTQVEAHAPITEALRARDVESAQAALVAHLAEGERRLLEKLAVRQPQPYVRPELFGRRPTESALVFQG